MAKKKNVQTPRASIFNRIDDGGQRIKTGSSIDTKKKKPISCESVWHQIKHTDVKNYHGKKFPCEVKREKFVAMFPPK